MLANLLRILYRININYYFVFARVPTGGLDFAPADETYAGWGVAQLRHWFRVVLGLGRESRTGAPGPVAINRTCGIVEVHRESAVLNVPKCPDSAVLWHSVSTCWISSFVTHSFQGSVALWICFVYAQLIKSVPFWSILTLWPSNPPAGSLSLPLPMGHSTRHPPLR